MKALDCEECLVHVNICTNDRPGPKPCCKNVGGQELYQAVKQRLKETGHSATLWVTRTGCLGFCNNVGTTVCIHPKGKDARWYSEVTAADLESIWKEIIDAAR